MKKNIFIVMAVFAGFTLISCNAKKQEETKEVSPYKALVEQYAEVELKTDAILTDNQKEIIKILIEASDCMERIFWKDAYGDKTTLYASVKDEYAKKYMDINYGPWDRLEGNKPFIDGVGAKPAGANYYPKDITKEEFEVFKDKNKTSWYNVIRRDEKGNLKCVPYHVEYKEDIEKAASLLKKAATLADDAGLKKYLELRSEALLTDIYLASDLAWMDMKNNTIDIVIGPIESYEDKLFGIKAAHSSQILIKDKEWSKKLSAYATQLPKLQKSIPVPAKYKAEKAKANADMNAYDVVYYAGDCNAGSKNIAINLPNDPRVHASKGSRKLQLKNAMKAKFDKILIPISNLVIDEKQQKHVTFDAFFENTMFHEVAHGLGINYTVKDKTPVRQALKDTYTSIEEAKADILGLYCITKLNEWGVIKNQDLMDNYVTFFAGIFRSCRFGAASAHGKANMMRFNFFEETGAFVRNAEKGTYKIDFEKMKEAMNTLVRDVIIIQGDGDYKKAYKLIEEKGNIVKHLQADLDRINSAGIPKDIIYRQGASVLGL